MDENAAKRAAWAEKRIAETLDLSRAALAQIRSGKRDDLVGLMVTIEDRMTVAEAGLQATLSGPLDAVASDEAQAANFLGFVVMVGILHVLAGICDEVEASATLPAGAVVQ